MTYSQTKIPAPVPTSASSTATLLRQNMRTKRRLLSKEQQQQHSEKIIQRIINSEFYKQSHSIALYLSADGEVDLATLIDKIYEQDKRCYLPVILSKSEGIIRFAPYHAQTHLRKNCFAILEPVYQQKSLRIAQQIDLILAPLVAFDEQGSRLGMGGGYYDRALQHLKSDNSTAPVFVGVAHEQQKVKKLDIQSWDVTLNAVITEKSRHDFYQQAQN